jgi:hypothetical protein
MRGNPAQLAGLLVPVIFGEQGRVTATTLILSIRDDFI